ncbi:hypothetical protein AAVH_05852 [Aphelenchoides avenae]|nr:hypothetical protein AAVH_05852 [Aphelenchus avenae]
MDSKLLAILVACTLAIGTTLALTCTLCSANDPSYCLSVRDVCQGTACYFRYEWLTSRREYGCMPNASTNGCLGDLTYVTCICVTENCNFPFTLITNGTKFR